MVIVVLSKMKYYDEMENEVYDDYHESLSVVAQFLVLYAMIAGFPVLCEAGELLCLAKNTSFGSCSLNFRRMEVRFRNYCFLRTI